MDNANKQVALLGGAMVDEEEAHRVWHQICHLSDHLGWALQHLVARVYGSAEIPCDVREILMLHGLVDELGEPNPVVTKVIRAARVNYGQRYTLVCPFPSVVH